MICDECNKPTRDLVLLRPIPCDCKKCCVEECGEPWNNPLSHLCVLHLNELNHYRREYEAAKKRCSAPKLCECGTKLSKDDCYDVCEECCEHEYDSSEGYMCLNCGADGAEHVMARAYEDSRYE